MAHTVVVGIFVSKGYSLCHLLVLGLVVSYLGSYWNFGHLLIRLIRVNHVAWTFRTSVANLSTREICNC